MKKMLMRTWQDRYHGRPGTEFAVPEEVAEELVEMDKRKFTVLGDVKKKKKAPKKAPKDKMVAGDEATKK